MAQLTSWSPIFCRILRCFATKEMSAQHGIQTPDLLHVKPVCYHYATVTSCNIELKVGSLNHLKYSQVSTFLSEINKAISYFIYLDITLAHWLHMQEVWGSNPSQGSHFFCCKRLQNLTKNVETRKINKSADALLKRKRLYLLTCS